MTKFASQQEIDEIREHAARIKIEMRTHTFTLHHMNAITQRKLQKD